MLKGYQRLKNGIIYKSEIGDTRKFQLYKTRKFLITLFFN